jgi:hypothetical protein
LQRKTIRLFEGDKTVRTKSQFAASEARFRGFFADRRNPTLTINPFQTLGEIEMPEEEKAYKKELSVKWIKADSGNTYLCPVDAVKKIDKPTEEQLKLICVDESHNPQTDYFALTADGGPGAAVGAPRSWASARSIRWKGVGDELPDSQAGA